MKIIRGIPGINLALKQPVVTIGNFDGVHLGHQEIFRQALECARTINGEMVVFTFHPHPLKILLPEKCPPLLNTFREKVELLGNIGIDIIVCLHFTRNFAEMSPSLFIKNVLIDKVGMKKMFVGYDFGFGKDRGGKIDAIQDAGEKYGFTVNVVPPLKIEDVVVSSTFIRNLIINGNVEEAEKYLGRHYCVRGRVVGGARRGRELGFPTANINIFDKIIPVSGVYLAETEVDGVKYASLVNVGLRPTFGVNELAIESFILDFNRDIYGKFIKVHFCRRLRDELKFKSAAELKAKMDEDLEEARKYFNCKKMVMN